MEHPTYQGYSPQQEHLQTSGTATPVLVVLITLLALFTAAAVFYLVQGTGQWVTLASITGFMVLLMFACSRNSQ